MNERYVIAEGVLPKVVERFAVLGQEVRLRLVERLAVVGISTPQELADFLGLTQQNVSKHLKILHRAGVVSRRQEGANVLYGLKNEATVRLLEDAAALVTQDLRDLSALAGGATGEAGSLRPGSDLAAGVHEVSLGREESNFDEAAGAGSGVTTGAGEHN